MIKTYKILFLVLGCTIAFFCVPVRAAIFSSSVEVCDKDSESITCYPKILLLIAGSQDGFGFDIEFTLDTETPIIDNKNREWVPEEPITLFLHRYQDRVEYPLSVIGTYQNAYETLRPLYEISPLYSCPDDAFCCWHSYPVARQLKFNETEYTRFDIGYGSYEYFVDVYANQETHSSAVVTLSHNQPIDSLAGLKAETVTLSVPNDLFFSFSFIGLFAEVARNTEGFLVPEQYIGEEVNNIGMTKESFLQASTCFGDVGRLTSVAGSSQWNQFEAFSQQRMADEMPYCSFDQDLSSTNSQEYPPYKAVFSCTKRATIQIFIELSAESFRIIMLYATPVLLDQGELRRESYKDEIVLHLALSNSATTRGVFLLRPALCSLKTHATGDYHTIESASTVSLEIDSYETKQALFFLPASTVTALDSQPTGYCAIEVSQHGQFELEVEVAFTGIPDTPVEPEEPDDDFECDDPLSAQTCFVIGRVCAHACTLDELWNAQLCNCAQINCLERYGPDRSHFNPQTRMCEELENSETEEDNPDTEDSDFDFEDYLNETVDCGQHGFLNTTSMMCTCDEGYVSSNSEFYGIMPCRLPPEKNVTIPPTRLEIVLQFFFETSIGRIAGSVMFLILFSYFVRYTVRIRRCLKKRKRFSRVKLGKLLKKLTQLNRRQARQMRRKMSHLKRKRRKKQRNRRGKEKREAEKIAAKIAAGDFELSEDVDGSEDKQESTMLASLSRARSSMIFQTVPVTKAKPGKSKLVRDKSKQSGGKERKNPKEDPAEESWKDSELLKAIKAVS